MVKTFYKTQPAKTILFRAEMKIRSYAYGADVNREFTEWLESYREAWNRPGIPFFLNESGDVSGNSVARCSSEFMHPARSDIPNRDSVVFTRKRKTLHPLWLDGRLYEVVGREGELTVNKQPAGLYLGTELKAWGCSVIWTDRKPTYYLAVIGKPMGASESFFTVYVLETDGTLRQPPLIQKPIESVLNAKSHLSCFGRHIFIVHGSVLDYFYFRPELEKLENVAIASDVPNAETECCRDVSSPVVADGQGRVYWQSGNKVYTFPVGYPRRVSCVDGGDQHEILRFHAYRDDLMVYRINRLNREYDCLRYSFPKTGEGDASPACELFNRGSVRNVIYYERNGETFYIRIPPNAYKATVVKSLAAGGENEQVLSSFTVDGIDEVFCADGCYYIGADYACPI